MAKFHISEWFNKSEIDYYSSFVMLWLSFNAYYKGLFQLETNLKNDRQFIEKLKTENTPIIRTFKKYLDISSNSNDALEFRFCIHLLIRQYDGGLFGNTAIYKDDERGIKPQMNGQSVSEVSFKDFIHIKNFQLKKSVSGYTKIENLYLKDDHDNLWKYFLEILYMLRNQLVHGILEPNDQNHETIKNCYVILRHLIKNEVK